MLLLRGCSGVYPAQTHLITCSSRLACSSACSASVTSWDQIRVRQVLSPVLSFALLHPTPTL